MTAPLTRAWFDEWFDEGRLPPWLREFARPFGDCARALWQLADRPERDAGLRKVMEARDCAVRAKKADMEARGEWPPPRAGTPMTRTEAELAAEDILRRAGGIPDDAERFWSLRQRIADALLSASTGMAP